MSERALRIGVAGLGRAFTLMLPTFRADPRVELVAAADPRPEARARFAEEFGARAYASVDALAVDPAVEVVYVASPHQFHAPQVMLAAARGKHVLVEKPMALSLAECEAMIAACRGSGVHLVVGHSHSFDAPIMAARRIVASGKFGRVRMITAFNFTDYLYRPRRPDELATAPGGGAVYNQAAHHVDIVRWLAGARAVAVRAEVGNWDPARPTEGAYSALLRFEGGAFASLVYSGYAHFDSDEFCGWIGEMGAAKNPDDYGATRRRLAAVQTREEEERMKAAANYGGAAAAVAGDALRVQHQHFGPLLVSCEHADLRPLPGGVAIYADGERRFHPLLPPAVPRVEVIDELYAAVVHGRTPLHDGASAMATVEVCLAMLQSAHERREVALVHQTDLPPAAMEDA
jgi:phthalate 4,5-cis-dihydrodiol dehydrogenase